MVSVYEEAPTTTPAGDRRHAPHLYYPQEGFGNLYRRVMVNDLFTELVERTRIRRVAEAPLDSYGIVGAGSLIFSQLGCDVSLISDERRLLDRAQALMRFNRIFDVHFVHSSLDSLPVEDDSYDFTWSFDRVQALSNPSAFLSELCRVSKATLVSVPNSRNYGRYAHTLYHRWTGTTCEYVGWGHWQQREPIREALRQGGMDIIAEDVIDVPWWPSFPELPNLVRALLRRPLVEVDERAMPELAPQVVADTDIPPFLRKVAHSAFIERGRLAPRFVKMLFAHNQYVMGCKPEYRRELGL